MLGNKIKQWGITAFFPCFYLDKSIKFNVFLLLKNVRYAYGFMMRLDEKPIFRKIIFPWYDSKTACLLLALFMVLVFLFGIVGLSVSSEIVEYNGFIWVPILLLLLSGWVIVSTMIRLIKRFPI
jgi:hypothetical protein|tara:strand:- start:114 stop:485 length:372 start_codon:yes stop_codon:yes gene_type:complete